MQTCSQIMTWNPVCCRPTDDVTTAARVMRDRDVGAVPVVEDDGPRLVGIVTDRDLTLRVLATEGDPRRTRLEDVMTRKVFTCRADDPVDRAIEVMERRQVRRIPIVDGARLVGIIAQADVASRLHEPQVLAELVEEVSRPAATGVLASAPL